MHGRLFCSAISCARRCFFTVIGKYVPPLTVASFATMTHSRCCTRPMPVTMPAAGASSSYIPFAASGDNSRNGVPGSSNAAMRSRTGSFPCWRCRSTYFAPPPSRAAASRCFSSATSPCRCSRFAANSAEAVSRCVSSESMLWDGLPDSPLHGGADGVHRRRRGCAGKEDLADAHGLELRDVLLGNDAAGENQNPLCPLVLEQTHDLGEEHVVRAGEDGEPDGVDVL